MAINFPSTSGQPTDGSFTHTQNNRTWEWNGESWSIVADPETDPVFSSSDAASITSQKISDWDNAYTNVTNILNGASADYDTFVEILEYIQNADTALNTDIIDNYNTLNTRIDNLEIKDSAGDETLEQSISTLNTRIDNLEIKDSAGDANLQNQINNLSSGSSTFSDLTDTPESNDDGLRADKTHTSTSFSSTDGSPSGSVNSIFDNNSTSYVYGDGSSSPMRISFAFHSNNTNIHSKVITGISLEGHYLGQSPGDFILYGSTSSSKSASTSGWTQLYSGTSSSTSSPQYFFFDNSTVFQTFMIEFSNDTSWRLTNLELFESPSDKVAVMGNDKSIDFIEPLEIIEKAIQSANTTDYNSNSTISREDTVIFSNPSNSEIQLTLPSFSSNYDGRFYIRNVSTGIGRIYLYGGGSPALEEFLYQGESAVVQSSTSGYRIISKTTTTRSITYTGQLESQDTLIPHNLIILNPAQNNSSLDIQGHTFWPTNYKIDFKNASSNYSVTLTGANVDGSTTKVIPPLKSLSIIRDGNSLRLLHDDRGGDIITDATSSVTFDSNNLVVINTAIKIEGVQELFSSSSPTIAAAQTVDFDAANSSFIHRIDSGSTISGNFTANVVNLYLADNYATNVSIIIEQGASPYIIDTLELSSASQTIEWAGGTPPTGNANKTDIISFTIFNLGSNTYKVLGQLTTFG